MRYDALVIGAGLGGLGAGIRLAQFGKRVVICERHTVWGGLNSFYKLEGRLFDSGLHALTNFAPRGERKTPLGRILRQLRIDHDALELGEQSGSAVRFPSAELAFSNDVALLCSEIARAFPNERDAFERLLAELPDYDALDGARAPLSARAELARRFREPLLVEMLLCPLLFYGGAREHDLDWRDFAILFRSIFLEGLARPAGGIRAVLRLLVDRFEAEGGELRLRAPVARIVVADGRARGVVLESGEELEAEHVYSSAGLLETRALCGGTRATRAEEDARLSFFETIEVLDRKPFDLGFRETTIFFSAHDRFEYRRPADFVDDQSGVVCTPNHYATKRPLEEGLVRVTLLANHARWRELDRERYLAEKTRSAERALAAAARAGVDVRGHGVFRDAFTPLTIERFTGHVAGAVYGAPTKSLDGSSGVANLSLIGTDQGLVGIVGALLSGITVVNRRALESARSAP
jgi:phytoene dehydrogenase-like protein